MEPTSSADNARQSRGLARFWPVHGMPAPAQRHPDDELEDGPDEQVSGPPAVSHSGSAQAAAAAQLNSATGEDALTSETQMVALGSRRGFEASTGARGWTGNQGGFPPPVDRNGEQPPRHGGGPVPNGQPASRPPFVVPAAATPPSPVEQQAPRPPFASGTPTSGAPSPFQPASPFAPQPQAPQPPAQSPPPQPVQQVQQVQHPQAQAPQPPAPPQAPPARPVEQRDETPDDQHENVRGIALGASAISESPSGETPRGAAAVPVSGRRRTAEVDEESTGDKPEETGEEPSRPATGWASVPTSGIPTISGSATVTSTPQPAPDEVNGSNGRVAGTLVTPISPASPVATPAEPAPPRRLASLADADAAAQPRAGRRTADPAPVSAAPLRPGDVNPSQIAFWDEEAITHFRSQWHEVKGDFVDDPVSALTRAHDLLTDAVNELSEALLAERDELDPLRDTSTPDTESMRMAMRGYREFLDRILAL